MKIENDGDKQDPLEKHSLPGTNQAEKGPGSREKDNQDNRAEGGTAKHQEELQEHSLPGTNQVGEGPGASGAVDDSETPGS